MRVLELYCGIGGCAAALANRATVVAAVDQNRTALAVYSLNFPHPTQASTIESIAPGVWREWDADLWWLSPPCQPFTRQGRQRDWEDPRAGSFPTLLARISQLRPRHLALENVPGFQGSRAHAALRATLRECRYTVAECLLCPTALGVPNRRQRFYLVASRDRLQPWPPGRAIRFPIADVLEDEPDAGLAVSPDTLRRFDSARQLIDSADEQAISSCFTAAYGKSPTRSGSYLRTSTGVRHFSPHEIVRLLGFPAEFSWPPELTLRQAWRLAGNSLSVVAVRHVLGAIPAWSELPGWQPSGGATS